MLWFKIRKVRYVIVIGAGLALAGCGFKPLYNQPAAPGEDNTYNVQRDLATINILPIEDRIGQRLHNHLLTLFNPDGRPAHPVYNLHVSLVETVQELGVQKSSFATRANLRIKANYSLSLVSGTRPGNPDDLPTGTVLAISSYDISSYEFTTQTARRDARKRAVRDIANELRTRLAIHFAQHRK